MISTPPRSQDPLKRPPPPGGKRRRSVSRPPLRRKERKPRPDAAPKPSPNPPPKTQPFNKDRKGELCDNFNRGTCKGKCPNGRTRKCSKRGANHPAVECKQ